MSQVTQHGNTNWLHGAMLVTTYVPGSEGVQVLVGGFEPQGMLGGVLLVRAVPTMLSYLHQLGLE